MKRIGILGSTGVIGRNALEVIRDQKEHFRVAVLGAHSNDRLLEEQAREFRPELVAVYHPERARALESRLKGERIRVVSGSEGMLVAAAWERMDMLLLATVGAQGLLPLCEAITAGKDIAIANKEPLVIAGPILRRLAEEHRVQMIPVDSEHSAVWQCLEGQRREDLERITLTASGGPFAHLSASAMERVTVEDALKHPTWRMGKKITVDSATLMNKGLEVIEAAALFGLRRDQIGVLIHPESIVHSLVEFRDGSLLAQLSVADMKLPIQYALSYPKRLANPYPRLDLAALGKLTFERPDLERFPALELAYEAVQCGGTMPAVLNAANEVAVHLFLEEKIRFHQIPEMIERVMRSHEAAASPDIEAVLAADEWARNAARETVLSHAG